MQNMILDNILNRRKRLHKKERTRKGRIERKKERESEREKGKKETNTIKDIWANC